MKRVDLRVVWDIPVDRTTFSHKTPTPCFLFIKGQRKCSLGVSKVGVGGRRGGRPSRDSGH